MKNSNRHISISSIIYKMVDFNELIRHMHCDLLKDHQLYVINTVKRHICVSVHAILEYINVYFMLWALTFSHYLSSGDLWPCEYVPPWVGVGFPSTFPNVSARVCNQIPTFQGSGLLSKKEQNSCVRVLNLIGSDIDGSGPGSLFRLEQRCVLKGRPCSSEQRVLLDIMNLLAWKKRQ